MLLLLPTKRNGIQELSRDVIHVSMRSILSSMKMQEVFIQIPRFEISYEHDLIESLKKLHVAEMFGRSANFSNIVSFNSSTLSVNHVFHSAKIKVDEEGSEAAAATGMLKRH